MAQKKRAKNEPTKGDLLAQQYRNYAAIHRVAEASAMKEDGTPSSDIYRYYWTPRDWRL